MNLFNNFSVIESLYLLLTLFSFAFSGDNSGQYRHPHLALAALELWISNQCMPDKCSAQWLDSPNGQGYATDSTKSTAIVWAEMDNNALPGAQPIVPYKWPNSEDGIYPGHKMLYGDSDSKEAPAPYVIEFVNVNPDVPATIPDAADAPTEGASAEDAPTGDASATSKSEPSSAWLMSNTIAVVFAGLACIFMM